MKGVIKSFDLDIEPYPVEIQRYFKRLGKLKNASGAIICPHDIMGYVSKNSHTQLMESVLGKREHWALFWREYVKCADD